MDWISVEDKLPDSDMHVLCVIKLPDEKPYVVTLVCAKYAGYDKRHFWNRALICDRYITHWMPLPEPPKGENNG